MSNKQISNDDDELGKLRAVIEAIRARAPDDAQWAAARERLLATLERATRQRTAPSLLTGLLQFGMSLRRLAIPGLAATAALVAILTGLVLFTTHRHAVKESGPVAAVGQVEQTHLAYVRAPGATDEKSLSPDDALHPGERVRVAPQGDLQVRLDDGSRLWLAAGTEAECVGPRSDESPAWRLLRGEIQAQVTPARARFTITTPGTAMRVLGTEFHVRVYPEQEPETENQALRNQAGILRRAIVVLTVLSGSVALETGGQQQVVPEGNRATVDTAQQTVISAEVPHIEYVRKWVAQRMSQPGQNPSAEVLLSVMLHPGLLHRLEAVDVETGRIRDVADFIGGRPEVVQSLNANLALIEVRSVLYGVEPIEDNAGHPLIDDQAVLVDLTQGEKATILPLEGWRPLYIQLSPDRRKLAFPGSRRMEDDRYEAGLLVMDLETFKPAVLLNGAMKTAPAWSPDSRWLAISKGEDYQTKGHEIVLIDTLTGEVKSTGLKAAGAVFSPDGKRLVFSAGFGRGGSWYRGVPTDGNLFIVTLPDGQPQQLTHLPNGGAVQPAFSPDGSRIAYWEKPTGDKVHSALHIVDLATQEDQTVCTITGHANPDEIRWTHDNGELLASYFDFDERVQHVKLAKRQGDDWTVTEPEIKLPKPEDYADYREVCQFAQRLVDVFTAHREGLKAQDLHRIDDALKKYALARDLAAGIVKDLERGAGEGVPAVKLQPSDVLPYQEAMARKAALSPQELSAQVVRSNLKYYVNSLLGEYYRDHDRFPPAENEMATQAGGEANPPLPTFAQWAGNLKSDARINYVDCATDHDLVRHFFVVPGDDPQQKATSYEVVRSDKEVLILRTPVLADGKRLEATYRVERDRTYEYQGKTHRQVLLNCQIADVR